MKKLSRFYHDYFKVFPNYFVLEDRDFMYKNIERRQRFIDEKSNAYARYKKRKENPSTPKSYLFNDSYRKDASIFKKKFSPRNRGEQPDLKQIDREFEELMKEVRTFPDQQKEKPKETVNAEVLEDLMKFLEN